MKLKVLIAVLSVILLCLLALVPYVHRMGQPQLSATIPDTSQVSVPVSTQTSIPTTSQTVTPPTSQVTTQPATEPATKPATQPATKPQTDSYSDNPKVLAFIEQRMKTWTGPVKDGFGEVTGSRKFATSRGGGKRAHAGLDFVAPHGTKVYAITSGTVQRVAVFYQSTWAVEVANDDGSILRYCEIATELKAGDRVEQGDIIGTIMRADGGTEMLHMEVYYGDGEGMLTQSGNREYWYVDDSKYYVRRPDLLDPTFLKDLPIG